MLLSQLATVTLFYSQKAGAADLQNCLILIISRGWSRRFLKNTIPRFWKRRSPIKIELFDTIGQTVTLKNYQHFFNVEFNTCNFRSLVSKHAYTCNIQSWGGSQGFCIIFSKNALSQSWLPYPKESAHYWDAGMQIKINVILLVLGSQLSNISAALLSLEAFQSHLSVYVIGYVFYKLPFLGYILLFLAYSINTSCENKPLNISRKQLFLGNN